MTHATAADATAMFDPSFASDRGVRLIRAVLDQARVEPQRPGTTVEPTDDERARLHHHHRIGPLVGRRFPSPESADLELDLMTTQLQLSLVAREVTSALTRENIDARILKGLATSELDYATPSLRHTADVDLLVATDDLDQAHRALSNSGLRTSDDLAKEGLILKGAVLLHDSGVEVDLHYRLSRFARPPLDDVLMEHPADMLFGLHALPPHGRLVHAAAHAVLSPNPGRRLSSVADIVAILDNTGVDWDRARHLADALGLTGAVGVALRAEARIMDRAGHPGLEWPTPPRLLHSMLETSRRRPIVEHWLALNALPPGTSRTTYVAQRLMPSAAKVEDRGGRIAYFRGLARKSRSH